MVLLLFILLFLFIELTTTLQIEKSWCPCQSTTDITANDIRLDQQKYQSLIPIPENDKKIIGFQFPVNAFNSTKRGNQNRNQNRNKTIVDDNDEIREYVCVCRREKKPFRDVVCKRNEDDNDEVDDPLLGFQLPLPAVGREFHDKKECFQQLRGATFQFNNMSSSSCDELGFESSNGTCAFKEVSHCAAQVKIGAASSMCEYLGGRLCTLSEALHTIPNTKCPNSNLAFWTSTNCSTFPLKFYVKNHKPLFPFRGIKPFFHEPSKINENNEYTCIGAKNLASVQCCADSFSSQIDYSEKQCAYKDGNFFHFDTNQYDHIFEEKGINSASNDLDRDDDLDDGLYVNLPIDFTNLTHYNRHNPLVLSFEVMGTHSAQLLLISNLTLSFEIILCGGSNNHSEIRFGEDRRVLVDGPSDLCLKNDTFRKYWLWYNGDIIQVGRGNVLSRAIMMISIAQLKGKKISQIAIGTSRKNEIFWRNFCVMKKGKQAPMNAALKNSIPQRDSSSTPKSRNIVGASDGSNFEMEINNNTDCIDNSAAIVSNNNSSEIIKNNSTDKNLEFIPFNQPQASQSPIPSMEPSQENDIAHMSGGVFQTDSPSNSPPPSPSTEPEVVNCIPDHYVEMDDEAIDSKSSSISISPSISSSFTSSNSPSPSSSPSKTATPSTSLEIESIIQLPSFEIDMNSKF
eukprot:c19769_g1_i1.p1 GENE.c19769_g1_i1~~c19769_g1_i1.p1  ORF type:complete len:700 (-),score=248.61 c19769_g1_i1:61-2109(-)